MSETRYRKKLQPPVVRATQWFKDGDHSRVVKRGVNDTPMVWNERSGWRVVAIGDWIVEDGLGGHFPCASEVFESIYEKVSP